LLELARLGSANVLARVIARMIGKQLLSSVAIDHFGLDDAAARAVSRIPLVGALVMSASASGMLLRNIR
jgi:uncharacterized membrane protein YdcZ (DUF606 family)